MHTPGKQRPDRCWSRPCRVGAAVGLVLVVASGVWGQFRSDEDAGPDRLPDVQVRDSDEALGLLRTAQGYVAAGKPEEALGLYQKVLEQFGDRVVAPADEASPRGGLVRYIRLSDYCHQQIARMGEPGLRLYRRRVDPGIERRYREAIQARDVRALERIVDEALCSSWGDEALDALGEMAWQRGDFVEAAGYWQTILDSCPTPTVDLAFVKTKRILAQWRAGQTRRALADLEPFRLAHAQAEAVIGGRRWNLVEFLTAAMQAPAAATQPAGPDLPDWPTFAGSASRAGGAGRPVELGERQWVWNLGEIPADDEVVGRRPLVDLQPQTYPIVVGGQVVMAQADRVSAVDLVTGQLQWQWQWRGPEEEPAGTRVRRVSLAGAFGQRWTLTACEGRIYACIGSWPATAARIQVRGNVLRRVPGNVMIAAGGAAYESRVVALDATRQGQLLWAVEASQTLRPETEAAVTFEGAPVADRGRLYVAMSTLGQMKQVYLVALEAATGRRLWSTFLGEAVTFQDLAERASSGHDLVTLGEETLYYCTHLGLVAAVRASNGRVVWLTRYPRQMRRRPSEADRWTLRPCVYAEGVVVAMPRDSRDVLALDARRGTLLWKAPADGLQHLVGVYQGLVIAMGDRVVAIELASGKRAWEYPQGRTILAGGRLAGQGRGAIGGKVVYWPTSTKVYVIDAPSGHLAGPGSFRLPEGSGDLVLAGDYILVTSPTRVTAYCQYSRLIDRFRQAITELGESAERCYRLGRAAQKADQPDLALEQFARARRLADQRDDPESRRIAAESADAMHAILRQSAARARQASRWAEAVEYLRQAEAAALRPIHRLEALVELADLWRQQNRWTEAVDVYQRILADPELREMPVALSEQVTAPARLLAADRIDKLIQAGGREVYAAHEQAAERLARTSSGADGPEGGPLEAVLAHYPNSQVAAVLLARRAREEAAAGHYGEAARLYRRLLNHRPEGPEAAQLWAELAVVYEQAGLWESAGWAWRHLQRRWANGGIRIGGRVSTAGQLAAARLAGAAYRHRAGTALGPPLPLERSWVSIDRPPGRLLEPEGEAPVGPEAVFLRLIGSQIECRLARSNACRWRLELAQAPLWTAWHGERLIAASRSDMAAIDLAAGKVVWRFEVETRETADSDPSVPDRAGGPSRSAGWLQGFRLAGDLVLCQQGIKSVLALEAAKGQVRWRWTAPGPLGTPRYADRQWFVTEVVAPRQVCVLEAAEGRPCLTLDVKGGRLVDRLLVFDEDKLCLVVQREAGCAIEAVDLRTGARLWCHQVSRAEHALPAVLRAPHGLLLLVDGTELVRLDADTGQAVWREVIGRQSIEDAHASLAVGEEAVYFVADGMLEARALADGRSLWRTWLRAGTGQWRLRLAGPWLVASPTEVEAKAGLAVWFCEADTGRRAEKLNLPAGEGRPQVWLGPEDVLAAVGPQVWGFRRAEAAGATGRRPNPGG